MPNLVLCCRFLRCIVRNKAGVNRGITLCEIQPTASIQEGHPWRVEFVRALAHEDLSPLTVRGYARDVELFLDWYAPNELDKLSAVDLIHLATFFGRNIHGPKRCSLVLLSAVLLSQFLKLGRLRALPAGEHGNRQWLSGYL